MIAPILFLLAVVVPAWPDLPADGFITGRVATDADVFAGRAVFSTGGTAGQVQPMTLTIPQYACWTSKDAGRQRVILLQAERAGPGDMVGLRTPRGEDIVAELSEVQLLGVDRPTDKDCL